MSIRSCEGCKFLKVLEDGRSMMLCNPLRGFPHDDCALKYIATELSSIRRALRGPSSKVQKKMEKLIDLQLGDLEEGEAWKRKDENPEEE